MRPRTRMTAEEKKEAEAAIYGLRLERNMEPMNAADVERMRELVAQHDLQNRPANREFDLNNPPKEPYVHQAFPKHKYHASGKAVIVASPDEEKALGDGWADRPFPQKATWRAKAKAPKVTKFGWEVTEHHVHFLQSGEVEVKSVDEAIAYLNSLDEAAQEEFFADFVNYVPAEEKPVKEEKKSKGKAEKAE